MTFAVHPGRVWSKTDGQWHDLNAVSLAWLYQLRGGEWIVWDDNRPQTYKGRRWEDYLHLYPSEDGRYGRPTPL